MRYFIDIVIRDEAEDLIHNAILAHLHHGHFLSNFAIDYPFYSEGANYQYANKGCVVRVFIPTPNHAEVIFQSKGLTSLMEQKKIQILGIREVPKGITTWVSWCKSKVARKMSKAEAEHKQALKEQLRESRHSRVKLQVKSISSDKGFTLELDRFVTTGDVMENHSGAYNSYGLSSGTLSYVPHFK